MAFSEIRKKFPFFKSSNLIYLDNAATTQKPQEVIDAVCNYYRQSSNPHRGIYELANRCTDKVEFVRSQVQKFINAESKKEIIFTHGTTDSINLVAKSYGEAYIKKCDEILVSYLEHHSNILPWQVLCQQKGAKLKKIPITDKGGINIQELNKLISNKTKLISISHASNVFGTINKIKEITTLAHSYGIKVFVDSAQAAPHIQINVKELNCDFLAFSGHKIYGPTGIGVLYGKKEILAKMQPYQFGGGMVSSINSKINIYEELPHCFEAGTQNIAGIFGLGAAIDFITNLGQEIIRANEIKFIEHTEKELQKINNLKLLSRAKDNVGIFSFRLPPHHPIDVGIRLGAQGFALRSGSLCATPLMKHLNLDKSGVVRISLGIYNTDEEINKLVEAIERIIQI